MYAEFIIYTFAYLSIDASTDETLSAWAVEFTDCIFAEVRPPTSVLDMILNNLMVRFQ